MLNSEQGKTIVLITDGSHTVGSFIEDSIKNSVEYAKKNHVVVHSIGIGSESGPIGYLPEYYNRSAVFDEEILMDISNSTGGKYFHALKSSDIEEAYEEISAAAKKGLIPLRLSHGLIFLALLLLFLEWGLISTRFRRIP